MTKVTSLRLCLRQLESKSVYHAEIRQWCEDKMDKRDKWKFG